MRILWLAGELRKAGLQVIEHADWKTHAAGSNWLPKFGVVHATAAPRKQTDATQVSIVRNGRQGLTGPIANACVDRKGVWHVLSAGRCNTTLVGTSGPFRGLGNTNALGIEGCNDNGLDSPAEGWPAAQYQSYARGWAVICLNLGWTTNNLVGHKEHTPGHKTDPTFNMDAFRITVFEHMQDIKTGGKLNTAQDAYLWNASNIIASIARGETEAETKRADGTPGTPIHLFPVREIKKIEIRQQTMINSLGKLAEGLAAILAATHVDNINEQQIADLVVAGILNKPDEEAAQLLISVLSDERARSLANKIIELTNNADV